MNLENKNLARDGFVTLKRWLENRNAGKTFVDYFHEYGYQTIAIYDAGELGRILYEEIKGSDIKIGYFVDRNTEGLQNIDGIPIIFLSQIREMDEVDALLVSPVADYDALCWVLSEIAPRLRVLAFKDAVYEF